MKFRFICFSVLLSISTLACAGLSIFKITPESTSVIAVKGSLALVDYTIENNSGFATKVRILPPISPQPTKVTMTDCDELLYGATCHVELSTIYAAQAGTLGSLSICDVSGSICSQSTEAVHIVITTTRK